MEEDGDHHQVATPVDEKDRIKIARVELEKILLEDSVNISEKILEDFNNKKVNELKYFLLKVMDCSKCYEKISSGLVEKILKEKFKKIPENVYNKAKGTLYFAFHSIVSKVLSGINNKGYLLDDIGDEDIKEAVDFFFKKITGNQMYWFIVATYIRVLFKEFGHDPKMLYK